MGKGKNTGVNKPVLAEMTKEQLVELAVEKGIVVGQDLERVNSLPAEEIIQLLIKADPSLTEPPVTNVDSPPSVHEGDVEVDGDSIRVPFGTIRTIKGVEMVKIAADKWVPTIRENIEEGSPVKLISKKRAGQTIFGKTGKPITFDENGRATVSAVDGQYLESIIIDGVCEYTVEG
jgi:hypothetical protein